MNAGVENWQRTEAVEYAGDRSGFIVRTYVHLFGAIVAFALGEAFLFSTGAADAIFDAIPKSDYGWLGVLAAFGIVGWLATRTAEASHSLAAQYAALLAYVGAEVIIFVPLLYIAQHLCPGIIDDAAIITLLGCAILTLIVMLTRKNFSFLKAFLCWGGVCAIGLIIAAAIFGFELGPIFSIGMIALAGAGILYDTSKVLHEYDDRRHVAAALALFASVALMFWYVLRLFLSRD